MSLHLGGKLLYLRDFFLRNGVRGNTMSVKIMIVRPKALTEYGPTMLPWISNPTLCDTIVPLCVFLLITKKLFNLLF